jgi:hypothetical protein
MKASVGRGCSDGIETRYGLDGPGIEFWRGRRFSAPFQTGPGSQKAHLYEGYRVLPGGKATRGVALTTHPHLESR